MATATAPSTHTPQRSTERDQRSQQARRAANLLNHASDVTRLQVLLILAEGETHVGAMVELLGQSQPALSHHLALLRAGSVVATRRQGWHTFYTLTELGKALVRLIEPLLEAEPAPRRRARPRRPESATTPGPATEPKAEVEATSTEADA